ncbi:MAG: hypothetical protein HYZ75_06795 [Elusimicrobia bacterium]|nr:hypothetical protein [Elusimicrobiota bacterium]
MSIRREWFKRHLEILTQALGTVLGLKGRGEVQASIAALESALEKAFGMNGQLALAFPLEQFLSLALRGEKASPELLDALSRLFTEYAALLESSGRNSEAASARERAAALRAGL